MAVKTKQLRLGDFQIPVYLMPDGKYCVPMTQVSQVIGFHRNWLSKTLKTEGIALQKLKEYGFKGDTFKLEEGEIVKGSLISIDDCTAVIVYAATVGLRKPAIALLATLSLNGILERLADDAFEIAHNEARNQAHEPIVADMPEQRLSKFVGLISKEDLKDISEAIAADCRRINLNDW